MKEVVSLKRSANIIRKRQNSIYTIPFSMLKKDHNFLLYYEVDFEEQLFIQQIKQKIPQEIKTEIEKLEEVKDIRKKNRLFQKIVKELKSLKELEELKELF